jgi:hypothetical protein
MYLHALRAFRAALALGGIIPSPVAVKPAASSATALLSASSGSGSVSSMSTARRDPQFSPGAE